MKKLISLLLAVSLMAMSTMASAVSLKAEGQRNPGTGGTADNNSNFLRDYSNVPAQLAVYRPGDTLTFFEESSNQIKMGDVITFISSYIDADDLNSATVMFIDQVVADVDSPKYSYKIREGLDQGIYQMDIKIGEQEVATFYYAIADPQVEIAYTDEDETIQYYYDAKDNKYYYFACATMGTDKVTYNQIGVAELGFDFGNGNVFTAAASNFDAFIAEQEVEELNLYYAIGVMDVDANNIPTASAVKIDE